MTVVFALLCAWPALAQDSLEDMLSAIPTIETQEPETEEAAEEEALPSMSRDDYLRACRDLVLARWEAPAKSLKKHPDAVVRLLVRIDDKGQRARVSVVDLSEDKKFNESVLAAVGAVESFPPPPPALRDTATQGVLVEVAASDAP